MTILKHTVKVLLLGLFCDETHDDSLCWNYEQLISFINYRESYSFIVYSTSSSHATANNATHTAENSLGFCFVLNRLLFCMLTSVSIAENINFNLMAWLANLTAQFHY